MTNTNRYTIQLAINEISHGCDGPITAFVLIARAMDLVAEKGCNPVVASNALDTCLIEFGFIAAPESFFVLT